MPRYVQFFANQGEPERAPNEVAHWLSNLTGMNHFLVHQALIAVNPKLEIHEGRARLLPTALLIVAAELRMHDAG